jgi:hypothetical protein
VAGLAGIPQAVRQRAAEAGLHLEAKLQAAFNGDSSPTDLDGRAADAATNSTHSAQHAAGAELPAREAALVQRLAALLEQPPSNGGLAALQTLWRESQSLVSTTA